MNFLQIAARTAQRTRSSFWAGTGTLLPLVVLGSLFAPAAGALSVTAGTNQAGNAIPFRADVPRYTQIYDSTWFTDGAMKITAVDFFRSSGVDIPTFDYELRLSTTTSSSTNFSYSFDDNTGTDEVLFAQGSMGPALDNVLSFAGTAFEYHPDAGNLFLDFRLTNYSGTGSASFQFSQAPGSQRIYSYNVGATIGQTGGTGASGLVTRFSGTPVPEPTTLAIFGFALVSMGLGKRKRLS